jgi:hypothetical protein
VNGSRLAPVPAEALPPADVGGLLGESEGYLVDAGADILGVVEEVVFDEGDRPEFLMVRRGGLNRHRALEVPAESVVEVHQAERRLVLGGYWQRI